MEIVSLKTDADIRDEGIAAFSERYRIEECMIRHIAERIASPCIPHYDHLRWVRNMLKALQECATVEPIKERQWQQDLFSQSLKQVLERPKG